MKRFSLTFALLSPPCLLIIHESVYFVNVTWNIHYFRAESIHACRVYIEDACYVAFIANSSDWQRERDYHATAISRIDVTASVRAIESNDYGITNEALFKYAEIRSARPCFPSGRVSKREGRVNETP